MVWEFKKVARIRNVEGVPGLTEASLEVSGQEL